MPSILLDVSSLKELTNPKSYNRPQYDNDDGGDGYISDTVYSFTVLTPTNLRQREVDQLEQQTAVSCRKIHKTILSWKY